MTYGDMIEKIMPEVEKGGTEPFLIYRDADGGWHGDFTQNQYGETFDWVEDARNADELSFVTRGLDFADGSYPYVFDKALCQRMSNEYYCLSRYDSGATNAEREERHKIQALLNFFEDNVGEFSQETLDCLIAYDRPLKALTGLCPFNMATGREDWTFNEDLAPDAVDAIERRVETLSERSKKELIDSPQKVKSADAKRVIDGYTERFSVALAGREVILAVDERETQDVPYLVCTARRDNPFGMTEYTEDAVTYDYLDAMRDFVDRVDTLLISLEKERASFLTAQPTLTSADCLKGGLDAGLTGKVVVIKPDVLSPEYRTANHQLKIVRGGFGANPNARGSAVFCKDLYSDKETRFERYDVAGVANPARLPQWAKDKLALLDAIKEPGTFEFGGYHFKPYRQFRKGEAYKKLKDDPRGRADMQYAMRNMSTDPDLNISWEGYSHEKFYASAGGNDTDIFKCVETNKLYVPCSGKLLQYKEPPVNEKTKTAPSKPTQPKHAKAASKTEELPQQKPSLLADLDASIKEAAQLAERKGANPAKKRGDLEVD